MYKKLLIFCLLMIVISIGYLINKMNNNSNRNVLSVTSVKQETNNEIPTEMVKSLVAKFEGFQEERNGANVMNLFSPPVSTDEEKDYDFIMANDIDGNSIRLFNTAGFGYHVKSYNMDNISNQANTTIAEVTETREVWRNVSSEYSKPIVVKRRLELTSKDNILQINKYYSTGSNRLTSVSDKYQGLFNLDK